MNRNARLIFAAAGAAMAIAYAAAILTGILAPEAHAITQAYPIPSPSPAPTP